MIGNDGDDGSGWHVSYECIWSMKKYEKSLAIWKKRISMRLMKSDQYWYSASGRLVVRNDMVEYQYNRTLWVAWSLS